VNALFITPTGMSVRYWGISCNRRSCSKWSSTQPSIDRSRSNLVYFGPHDVWYTTRSVGSN